MTCPDCRCQESFHTKGEIRICMAEGLDGDGRDARCSCGWDKILPGSWEPAGADGDAAFVFGICFVACITLVVYSVWRCLL